MDCARRDVLHGNAVLVGKDHDLVGENVEERHGSACGEERLLADHEAGPEVLDEPLDDGAALARNLER